MLLAATEFRLTLLRVPTPLPAMSHTACRLAPGSAPHGDGAALRCRRGSGGRWGTPGKVPVESAFAASGYARRRCGGTFRELGYVGETPGTTCASHPRRDARCRWGHVRQEPMVRGLSAGGRWIRTFSSWSQEG